MQDAQAEAKREAAAQDAFLAACSAGDLTEVRAAAQTAGVAARDQRGATGLHLAAARGRVEVISFLASHGADVEAEDAEGRTPLLVASLAAQLPAVDELLTRGCWVEASDSGERSPLSWAAAQFGGGACVRRLLAAGARHAVFDKRGLSPLAHAVVNENAEAVQALLQAGASAADALSPVALRASGGCSLLHLAASLGSLRSARLLLAGSHGKAGDAENEGRLTLLHAAAAAGRPETLSLLLGWTAGGGCDVNAHTSKGETALDLVALLPASASEDAAACTTILRAAGGKTSSQLPAPAAAPTPPQVDPPASTLPDWHAEASRFVALSREKQTAQLERWASKAGEELIAAALAGRADPPLPSPPPLLPSLPPDAAASLRAAAELRRTAELAEVMATLLADDDWQELMARPAVLEAVQAVQADPSAASLGKWENKAETAAAMAKLRKLQGFCAPRGLRVALPQLLRREGEGAAEAEYRAEMSRFAAGQALGAARGALLRSVAADKGEVEAPRPGEGPRPAAQDSATGVKVEYVGGGWPIFRATAHMVVLQCLFFLFCGGCFYVFQQAITPRAAGTSHEEL